MKKQRLENYPEDVQDIVKVCNALTKHIQGIRYLPSDCVARDIEWKRINHCQAWYGLCEEEDITFIRSYNTVVAFLYQDTLYSLGRYSMTTYQHIRKFRNNYTRDSYNTPEKNLALVDWF